MINKQGSKNLGDESMVSAVVEDIISSDADVHYDLKVYQQQKIKELTKMLKDKESGRKVNISVILNDLRKSGIIDENGDLSKHYRDE